MNKFPNFKDPVVKKETAIETVGSKAKLARLLHVSRSTVTAWKEIPLHQAYRLVQMYPELNENANSQ
jgi:DNA-binding transcriptional regulator YdaS (Cro superfamily)